MSIRIGPFALIDKDNGWIRASEVVRVYAESEMPEEVSRVIMLNGEPISSTTQAEEIVRRLSMAESGALPPLCTKGRGWCGSPDGPCGPKAKVRASECESREVS